MNTANLFQPVAMFNIEGQRLLNKVVRDPATDAEATTLLINHGATDLLEMLGLS